MLPVLSLFDWIYGFLNLKTITQGEDCSQTQVCQKLWYNCAFNSWLPSKEEDWQNQLLAIWMVSEKFYNWLLHQNMQWYLCLTFPLVCYWFQMLVWWTALCELRHTFGQRNRESVHFFLPNYLTLIPWPMQRYSLKQELMPLRTAFNQRACGPVSFRRQEGKGWIRFSFLESSAK